MNKLNATRISSFFSFYRVQMKFLIKFHINICPAGSQLQASPIKIYLKTEFDFDLCLAGGCDKRTNGPKTNPFFPEYCWPYWLF